MNEQLQQALTDLINKSMSGVDAATGFLAAEVPDVVQQLLMWHAVYNAAMFIFALIMLFSGVSTAISAFASGKLSGYEWNKQDAKIIFGVISVIVFLYTVNLTWLKIWIAPKVWLLEYAASLAK